MKPSDFIHAGIAAVVIGCATGLCALSKIDGPTAVNIFILALGVSGIVTTAGKISPPSAPASTGGAG